MHGDQPFELQFVEHAVVDLESCPPCDLEDVHLCRPSFRFLLYCRAHLVKDGIRFRDGLGHGIRLLFCHTLASSPPPSTWSHDTHHAHVACRLVRSIPSISGVVKVAYLTVDYPADVRLSMLEVRSDHVSWICTYSMKTRRTTWHRLVTASFR
jgi:hypothetical protein